MATLPEGTRRQFVQNVGMLGAAVALGADAPGASADVSDEMKARGQGATWRSGRFRGRASCSSLRIPEYFCCEQY
jgi:hypothetical protein